MQCKYTQRSAGRAAGWNSEAPSGQDRDCSLPLHANASYISAAYPCSMHSHDAQHKIIFVCASADTHQTSKQNVEPVNKSLETWNGLDSGGSRLSMRYYTLFTVRWRGLGFGPAELCHFFWPWTRLAGASGQRRFAMPQARVCGMGLVSKGAS